MGLSNNRGPRYACGDCYRAIEGVRRFIKKGAWWRYHPRTRLDRLSCREEGANILAPGLTLDRP